MPTTASPFTRLAEAGRWPPVAVVLSDVDLSSDPIFPFSDAGIVVHVKEVSVASVAVRDTELVVVVATEEGGAIIAGADSEEGGTVVAGAEEGSTVVTRVEAEDVIIAGAEEGGTVVARTEAEDVIVVVVHDKEPGLPPSVLVGFAWPVVVFLSTSS